MCGSPNWVRMPWQLVIAKRELRAAKITLFGS
jgi:hypothetical protein